MTIFPLDCRDSCSVHTMRDNAKSSAFSLYLSEIVMHMTYARGHFRFYFIFLCVSIEISCDYYYYCYSKIPKRFNEHNASRFGQREMKMKSSSIS